MKILIIVLSVLLVLINPFLLPSPVWAATETEAVNSTHTSTGSTAPAYTGGAADYTNLNSDDGDTSYASDGGAAVGWPDFYARAVYSMTAFTANYTGSPTVTLYIKARPTTLSGGLWYGINRWASCLSGGTYFESPSRIYASDSQPDTSYLTGSYKWDNNPKTGTAWNSTTINAAKFGWKTGGPYTGYITYMYVVVTYIPSTVPTASTSAATGIEYTGGLHKATLNGSTTDDGGMTVDYYGFIWNTTLLGDPGNVAPSASTHSNWTSAVGDYGLSAFSHQITGLTKGVTYYFRAASHNVLGWDYGDRLSFTALTDPTVVTVAATNVASSTARLNSSLTASGGEACTISFAIANSALGPFANFAAIQAAGWTYNATGTYTSGQTPYVDVTGLTAAINYTFMVKATNTVSSQYGSQLTFSTASGIFAPTNVKGIPTATSILLQWAKGVGSTNTRVQYKQGAYPTSTTDGATAYFSTMASVTISSLLPGNTYYIRLWGESGGTYSATNATLLLTTLASTTTTSTYPTVTTPDFWFQSPDYTNMATFILYDWFNWIADTTTVPRPTFWFFLAIGMSVFIGIIIYTLSHDNLVLAFISVIFAMMIGSFMELMPMWLLLPEIVMGVTAIFVGERR